LSQGIVRKLLSLCAGLVLALSVTAGQAWALPAAGTTPTGDLVLYDTETPGSIFERHTITGLLLGERIDGLDVRPANGKLYALGIVPGAQNSGRIYTIDPGTGAATPVGSGPFSTTLPAADFGFDFNPAADRIRVVASTDQNMRVHPDTGDLAGNDTALAGPGSEEVSAVAYDQNVAGTPQTTLFGYDLANDRVVRIGGFNGAAPEGSPNLGVVTPLPGASGIAATDAAGVGMDIAPGGVALLTAPTSGNVRSLYRVNLATGVVTPVGAFSQPVDDVAVLAPSSFELDSASVSLPEGAGSATITVVRAGNATGTQTVAYTTGDGTAVAADYTAAFGTLTFGPGETSKTFSVPLTDDAAVEPSETIALSLSAPTGGAALGGPATGTLTILDDDAAQPLPPDTMKPELLLSVTTPRRLRNVVGGVTGKLSVTEACAVGLRLRLGGRTLGTAQTNPSVATVRRIRVRLTGAGRRALERRLRRRKTTRLTLTAIGTDAARNRGRVQVGLTVKR
jgi:hypothetical protein